MSMEEVSVIKTPHQSVLPVGKSFGALPKAFRTEKGGDGGGAVARVSPQRVSLDQQAPSSEKKVGLDDINSAIQDINRQLEVSRHTLRFQIDDSTEEIKVQVVDKETGKVVRTIPPEPSLGLLARGEVSALLSVHG